MNKRKDVQIRDKSNLRNMQNKNKELKVKDCYQSTLIILIL